MKQSLFDILSPLIPEAIVYDCFAGTGSMGLECLSRGARFATFFEADRSAVALLKKNIAALKLAARSAVVGGDIFKAFEPREAGDDIRRPADLVFLDPPYRYLNEQPDSLRRLAGRIVATHLAADGVLVLRRDAGDSLELPALARFDLREYGSMAIELLRPIARTT